MRKPSKNRWTGGQITVLGFLLILNTFLLLGGGLFFLTTQLQTLQIMPDQTIMLAVSIPVQVPAPTQALQSQAILPAAYGATATPTPLTQVLKLPPTLTIAPENTPLPTPVRILIGYSVESRPMEVYKFGTGPVERMIVAGIHGGNEFNTINLARELIQTIQSHPNLIPDNVTLYLLPALNPDGEARSLDEYGRANVHGVDLNHNWPVNWEADWNRKGCWDRLRLNAGSGPGSEPETIALMNFLITTRVDALISYHAAALGIYPGGDPADHASVNLAKTIAAVSNYAYPPIITGCDMTGSLADWAVAHGIAAVDIELTDHQNTDLGQNLGLLPVFLSWKYK